MKQFLAKIWHSPSVRNVGELLSANIIAQAIGILIYPLLTRMYAPEDFALLNLFTSIVGVLVIVATAEYQYAIVLPKDDKKAIAIVYVCLLILSGVTLVVSLTIPFAAPIAGLFNAPELARYWWLIPFSVAGLSLWNILNYWYIRRKAFTRISGYQITQSAFSAAGKISFGWLGRLHSGLIVASVLAPIAALLLNVGLAWKQHLRFLFSPKEKLRTVAKEYANFPKFSLPLALVNSVGVSLPVWLLTPAFGLEKVGYLSLAMMAAFVPLNIIARACNQVMYQKVVEKVNLHESIRPILLRFIVGACLLMFVGLTAIYIIVPELVTFLFGADWIESAYLIRRMLPYLFLMPVCGSICFLSDVFAKQKIAMWMEATYVGLMALVLFVGVHLDDFGTAVSLYACLGFGYLLVQLLWFVSLIRRYQRTL